MNISGVVDRTRAECYTTTGRAAAAVANHIRYRIEARCPATRGPRAVRPGRRHAKRPTKRPCPAVGIVRLAAGCWRTRQCRRHIRKLRRGHGARRGDRVRCVGIPPAWQVPQALPPVLLRAREDACRHANRRIDDQAPAPGFHVRPSTNRRVRRFQFSASKSLFTEYLVSLHRSCNPRPPVPERSKPVAHGWHCPRCDTQLRARPSSRGRMRYG